MNRVKPQLLTDSFQIPKRGGKKKSQKSTSRTKDSKKQPTQKEPRPKRTPMTPEEKKGKQRVRDYANYENAKAVGQCRSCEEKAIPGETRCEVHLKEHRVWRRGNDRERYAAEKEASAADALTKTDSKSLPNSPPAENGHKVPHEVLDENTAIRKLPAERREINNQSQRKRRAGRVAQGICVDSDSGNHKAAPGKTRCDDCAEAYRVRRRKNDADRREREKDHRGLGNSM